MKIGDKVQAWSDTEKKCLGWGTIIEIATSTRTKEKVPLIKLENGKTVWGDVCYWIDEKKAIEVGVSVYKAVTGEDK